MTDSSFLLAVLSDGKPHSTSDILQSSFKERGVGLMVHSRAADLRKLGHFIVCERVGSENGRPVYEYQLLGSLRDGDSGSLSLSGATPTESPSQSEPEQPELFTHQRTPEWA